MSKEPQKSNFELAQEEANKIDLQIIDTLQKGYNFRVEAGAGSGKTYSLNKVVEWTTFYASHVCSPVSILSLLSGYK